MDMNLLEQKSLLRKKQALKIIYSGILRLSKENHHGEFDDVINFSMNQIQKYGILEIAKYAQGELISLDNYRRKKKEL